MKKLQKYSAWSLSVFLVLIIAVRLAGYALYARTVEKLGETIFSYPKENISYLELKLDQSKPPCNPDMSLEEALVRVNYGGCAVDICHYSQKSNDNSDNSGIDDLFGESRSKDPLQAAKALIADCIGAHRHYALVQQHRTAFLKVYVAADRAIYQGIMVVMSLGNEKLVQDAIARARSYRTRCSTHPTG